MSAQAKRILGITLATAVVCVLLGLYVGLYLTNVPGSASAATTPAGASLYLGTVPAAKGTDPHPSWVSYYAVNPTATKWTHDTTFNLPAHTLVRITIYQFDGDSGLRNPFISQATGTVGDQFLLNGKPTKTIDPDTASHVFAVPQWGLSVPLQGVPDSAKNPCANAPCRSEIRPRDDLVHGAHAGTGPVPLAVLRSVRRGLHRRLGRPDADRRLHGRLHQGHMRRRPR